MELTLAQTAVQPAPRPIPGRRIMQTDQPTDVRAGSSTLNWLRLTRQALFGFLGGYFILHPVAMVIFALLDTAHVHHGSGTLTQLISAAVLHSFHLSMLPMGLAFGVVSAIVAIVQACQHHTIERQRDLLRQQLARNNDLMRELEDQGDVLRKQNDRLIELERTKRRTTTFLVHDFKTQLNCIEGFSTLLLENEEARKGEMLQHSLVRIRRQAKAMLTSVATLRDISRLEDAPVLHTESVSPYELLRSAADEAAVAGRNGCVGLETRTRDCPSVVADPELIRRVLLNLVSNAIKHNGPETHVVLGAKPDFDSGTVVFTCSDDGEGIPPDRLVTIFEPFRSGDGAPATSTGLGLAFARSAIEAHGGKIWCESTLGQGAAFHFSLGIDPGYLARGAMI